MVIQSHCICCGLDLAESRISLTGILCAVCGEKQLFRKKLVITGITRMQQGKICVSGIDPLTWKFVRPVCFPGLEKNFLMQGNIQVISHFNLVEMEFVKYRPAAEYHTEDWTLSETFKPRFIRKLREDEILRVLQKVAIGNLQKEIEKKNRSLFVVKAKYILDLWHEQHERFNLKLSFMDDEGQVYIRLPVTDLLLLSYAKFMVNNRRPYALELMQRFNNSPHRFVRIGLTRPYNGRQYWEQATALFAIPGLFNGQNFMYYEKLMGEEV